MSAPFSSIILWSIPIVYPWYPTNISSVIVLSVGLAKSFFSDITFLSARALLQEHYTRRLLPFVK